MQVREKLTGFYLADPAFAHWSGTETYRWGMTRDAEQFPQPLKPGAAPVEYRFHRLTRTQVYTYVQTAATEHERYERAFAAGIVEIVGGPYGAGWRPAGVGSAEHVAATPAELDEAGITMAEAWDVGQWIYGRSILGKGCAPRLHPLPSSLLAWDALERPSAESSQG